MTDQGCGVGRRRRHGPSALLLILSLLSACALPLHGEKDGGAGGEAGGKEGGKGSGGKEVGAGDGEDVRACFDAARALDAGAFDAAVDGYTRCIGQGGLSADNLLVALNDRGKALARNGQHELAVADFSRVIELRPQDVDGWYNRGLAHRQLDRLQAALADYGEALRLDPHHVQAWNNRGVVHGRQGRFELAMADFRRAIDLDPDYAGAWYNRALVHYSRGDYQDTVRDLERAIALAPHHGRALQQLAWLRATCPDAALRDGRAAIALGKRALTYLPRNPAVYDTLAAAYAADGDYDRAVAWQKKALEVQRDIGRMSAYLQRLQSYRDQQPVIEQPVNRFDN